MESNIDVLAISLAFVAAVATTVPLRQLRLERHGAPPFSVTFGRRRARLNRVYLARDGLPLYIFFREYSPPLSEKRDPQETRSTMPKRRSEDDRPRRNVRFTDKGYSVDPGEILKSKSAQEILRNVRENFPAPPQGKTSRDARTS